MTNKPRIRFRGFTEDWEQRKLGDIATFSKGNGYSKSDLAPSGEPIILYGRLYTNYETTIRNVDTFVELKDKSVISQGGEVIVPASGETAEDISRASVVKNQGIIIGGDLNVIKVNHLLDPTFLALTISNGEQQKELSKRAQGKSVVHLHNSDLQDVNLTFPLLNEQKEISSLFEKMDSVISLHQRKLEKIKLTKKALLQKLFPKNGSNIPELRFKGFTDAWEQRKFKDIAFKRGEISEADLPYVEFEDINSGIGTLNKNISQKVGHKKGILFETGDVLFGKLRPYLQNWLLCQFRGIAVGDFWVLQPQNVSPAFLYYLIQSEAYQSVANISSGTKMPRSSWSLVSETQFSIPKYNEVNMIGEFFSSIDKNITLHQRKLERLQEVKQGLLQKMFV
ncbi:restriction endonuclease subunit S [Veillonella fallax]|uniref:Restriction endonuclease subunit S n=1 Tax=Veillonella fallax TaxID=2881272 RepID=A0ABS8F627_9FIRM|nr:restriction endonuclease subunit S [Veillonella fallax]MCC2157109.1 restriction endonuclease subunit S [Veillonella fallax]